MATFVFLLPFKLSKSLMDLQRARYDEEIVSRTPDQVKKWAAQ